MRNKSVNCPTWAMAKICYEYLGLKETASIIEVRAAYKQLMLVYHPDKGGSNEIAKKINYCHETIINFNNHTYPRKLPPILTPEFEQMHFGDISNRPSRAFAEKLLNSMQDFEKLCLVDNFRPAIVSIINRTIMSMTACVENERPFFCQSCDKRFASEADHDNKIIQPYIIKLNEGPQIFTLLEKLYGSRIWKFKPEVPTKLEMEFWNSSIWLEVSPKVGEIMKFYRKVPRGLEIILKLVPDLKQIAKSAKLKAFVASKKYPILADLEKLTFCLTNGRGEDPTKPIIRGMKVQLKLSFLEKRNIKTESTLAPYYIISDPPGRERSSKCSVCDKKRLIFIMPSNHCRVCGRNVCEQCFLYQPVLHLGYNSKVKVCRGCISSSNDMDCRAWADGALAALEAKRADLSQAYLTVCHFLCQRLDSLSTELKNILNDVASLAAAVGDTRSLILAKRCLRIDERSWGWIAVELVDMNMGAQAVECLKEVPQEKNSDKWWDNLGDEIGLQDIQVALYCYDRISLKGNSASWWIEKSRKYERNPTKAALVMTYHCLQKALEALGPMENAKMQIVMFLQAEEYRLALFSLEIETKRIGLKEIKEMLSILGKSKIRGEEVELRKRILPFIVLVLYARQSFGRNEVQEMGEWNMIVGGVLRAVRGASVRTMEALIDELDGVKKMDSRVISIMVEVKGNKEFMGWEDARKKAMEREKFHAGMMLAKIAMLGEGGEEGSSWFDLGFSMIEEGVLKASSLTDRVKVTCCFLLAGADVFLDPARLRTLKSHPELIATLLLHIRKTDMLYKLGLKLELEGGTSLDTARFLLGVYLRELSTSKNFDTMKMSRIFRICGSPITVFTPGVNKLQLMQAIIATFPKLVKSAVAFGIHRETIGEIEKLNVDSVGLPELAQLLAVGHILSEDENGEAFGVYNRLLPQVLCRLLGEAFDSWDFKKLGDVLVNVNAENVFRIETFYSNQMKLGSKRSGIKTAGLSPSLSQCKKIALSLMTGIIQKIKGGNPNEVLSHFSWAMDICPTEDIRKEVCLVVSRILKDDPYFFKIGTKLIRKELEELKEELEAENFSLEEFQHELDKFVILIPGVGIDENVMRDQFWELIENIRMVDSGFFSHLRKFESCIWSLSSEVSATQKGLMWVDFSERLASSIKLNLSTPYDHQRKATGKAAAWLIAGMYFLEAMINETVGVSRKYGLMTLIGEVTIRVQTLLGEFRVNPFFQTVALRAMISLKLKAALEMALVVNLHRGKGECNSNQGKVKVEVIPFTKRQKLEEMLQNLLELTLVTPFIVDQMSCVVDLVFMDENRAAFIGEFLQGSEGSPGSNGIP